MTSVAFGSGLYESIAVAFGSGLNDYMLLRNWALISRSRVFSGMDL